MSRSSDSPTQRFGRPPIRSITTIGELAAALPLRHGDVVVLDTADLSAARQEQLNDQLGECGCDAGERGAARGLLLAGLLCVVTGGRLRAAPTLAAAGLCGAGLGKFLGRRAAVAAAGRSAAAVVGAARGSRPFAPRRRQGTPGELVSDGRR